MDDSVIRLKVYINGPKTGNRLCKAPRRSIAERRGNAKNKAHVFARPLEFCCSRPLREAVCY